MVIWFSITFEIVFAGRLSTCHEVDHKADQGARVVHQGGRSIRWGFAILCVHSWKVTVWEKATHAAYSIQIFRCENESSSTFQYSCPIHSYLASQKMFQKCISFHFEYAFCHWQAVVLWTGTQYAVTVQVASTTNPKLVIKTTEQLRLHMYFSFGISDLHWQWVGM